VEATVDGRLLRQGNRLLLRINGSRELTNLVPLRNKVQWDLKRKRLHPIIPAERGAFARLQKTAGRLKGTVRVTGPLEAPAASGAVLEVRRFQVLR
jgi:hypothetical protein